MKTIYLIRHPKAALEGKEEERPLADEGVKQAEQLSGVLEKLDPKISKLYASPYKRAIQTLEPLAERAKVKIDIIEELRELQLAAGPVKDMEDVRRKLWDDEHFSLPGGESRKKAVERVISALDKIRKEIKDGMAAAVVSHGTLIGALLKSFDPNFGYEDWRKMTMPDIFKLSFNKDKVKVDHVDCVGIDTFAIGQKKNIDITKEYLKEKQYKQSQYLEARIAIHKKFSTNPESLHTWVWDRIHIQKPVKILDIGCGTAEFWKENYNKLPSGSFLVLTDFSEGMLAKAKKSVTGVHIAFEVADIDRLPYPDESFDVVMAHHVVYHAEKKDIALSELKRVLKSDGCVTITTNSNKHMLNIYEMGRSLDRNFPMDRIIDSFTEEIADELLPRYFRNIEKHVQEDFLKVTDEDTLIHYVASGVEPRNIELRSDFYDRYREGVRNEMKAKGFFGIPKRSPLFICKK